MTVLAHPCCSTSSDIDPPLCPAPMHLPHVGIRFYGPALLMHSSNYPADFPLFRTSHQRKKFTCTLPHFQEPVKCLASYLLVIFAALTMSHTMRFFFYYYSILNIFFFIKLWNLYFLFYSLAHQLFRSMHSSFQTDGIHVTLCCYCFVMMMTYFLGGRECAL